MSINHTQEDGTIVEVFTAEEVQAQTTAAVTAKESEWGKTKEQIERERDEARTALGERANEFAQFRKLSDEQVKKLDEKDRIIYENGLALNAEREKNATEAKKQHDAAVEAAIRAKAGTDEKLFGKIKDMYALINIEAVTPEQISNKVLATLGAISTIEPDLLASVAGFSGGYQAPKVEQKEGETFADTVAGKGLAKEIGLELETPKS
jgi:hypothetical protein